MATQQKHPPAPHVPTPSAAPSKAVQFPTAGPSKTQHVPASASLSSKSLPHPPSAPKSNVNAVPTSVFKGQGSKNANLDPHRRGSAWSITSMPKEIAAFAIDEMPMTDVKAADMERHKKDDSLDAFQRALLCLKTADISQKVFAGQNLASLINQDENRAFQEIIPAIAKELKRINNPELHEAVAKSIAIAVPDLLKKNPQRGKVLIQMSAEFVASTDTEISDAWYKCFDTLVGTLGNADLQREIVPQITERFGKEASTVNAKRVAAKLINRLTSQIPEEVLSKRLMPVVEALCMDKDNVVKGSMYVRLPEVIIKLKEKNRIFELVKNLMNEEDSSLIAALIGAVGKTVILMNPKDPQANPFYQAVIPMIKKLVKKAFVEKHTNVLIDFTANMGEMSSIFASSGVLSSGDKLWFLDAFLQLSRFGLPPSYQGKGKQDNMPIGFANFRANMEFNRRHSLMESLISTGASKGTDGPGTSTAATLALLRGNNNVAVRKGEQSGTRVNRIGTGAQNDDGWTCRANAANGFFHFLKFAKPLVDFRNGLHPIMVDLMHDPVPAVRAKMAATIYPVIEYLGVDGALLHGEVVYALSDDNISVIEAIIPNLANILKVFVQAKLISPDGMTNAMVEIGGALLFCEERLSQTNDWRIHAVMLEQLSVLPFCLPGDYVYNNFVPALFHRLLHMRQLPCRIAAADAIVAFLRHCRRSGQRDDIRRRIKEGFAQGRSVHDRMLFMFMSKKIMDLFSRKYYRDHFFETTLAMTDDAVPNIRLKAVTMMPDLKGVLQMSEDPTMLKKLEDVLAKIKTSETDRDVQSAIEAVMPEMVKIGVVLKNQSKGPKTKADLEDEAKEREETFIANLEGTIPVVSAEDKRKLMFKSSKRHSDPPVTPKVPEPPPPAPPQKAVAPPSTDTTKLALQMKGHGKHTPNPVVVAKKQSMTQANKARKTQPQIPARKSHNKN